MTNHHTNCMARLVKLQFTNPELEDRHSYPLTVPGYKVNVSINISENDTDLIILEVTHRCYFLSNWEEKH